MVVCQVCGKHFPRPSKLSRHELALHTPVPCKRCPELGDFPDRAALKAHERTHQGTFQCPRVWCVFKNNRRTTFDDHVRDCRASMQSIICGQDDCDRSYGAIRSYQLHLRNDHNMTLDEVHVAIAAERPADDLLEDPIGRQLADMEDPIGRELAEIAEMEDAIGRELAEPIVMEPAQEPEPLRFPQGPGYDLNVLVINDDRTLITYGRLKILYCKPGRGPLLAYLRSTPDTIVVRFHGRGHQPSLAPETNVELHHRALHGDYANGQNRYDKGHLMMADNLAGDEETAQGRYVYSITLPQLADFNQKVWNELERYERLFITTHVETDSYAGGFYIGQVAMCGRLRIPSHFFKILIGTLPNGQTDVEVFILQHRVYPAGIPLKTFHRTWEELRQMDLEGVIPQFQLDNVRRFNVHNYEEFGGW